MKIKWIFLLAAFSISFWYFLEHPDLRQKIFPGSPPPALTVRLEPAPETSQPVHEAPLSERRETHERIVSHRCIAPPTRAVTAAPQAAIYRWTDERGNTSYSDRPPADADASLYDPHSPLRLQYFVLDINFVGNRQVPYLHARLHAGTTRIYKILGELLGMDRLRQVELNVRIYSDKADYQRYAVDSGTPRSANAGGFYSLTRNEAVTFQYPDNEQTLSVLKHEAVHVIVAGLLGGNTPLWLNEGLAEYFETLESVGQSAVISPDTAWLTLARQAINAGYPRTLLDFLALDGDVWYGAGQATHYALASSLVYFLMDSSQGRSALSSLMHAKAENYCAAPDQERWLSRSYPGGAAALQREFYQWLRDTAAKKQHRY